MTPDLRTTLIREGLAAGGLEGLVPAAAYAETRPMQTCLPQASLYSQPDLAAEQQTQLLFGERFDVLGDNGDFVLGQARRDGYVGYVRRTALTVRGLSPTHWICVPQTFALAEPDIKSAASGPYWLNSLITVVRTEGRFCWADGLGWMVSEHLMPVGIFRTDFVAVAESLSGAGYVWGGRMSSGLDCSGLVQQARLSCGLAFPRDTDQQITRGRAVEDRDLQRGDLVFWRGHVGVMVDEAKLIHANAHHMAVTTEPLAEAVERIAAGPTGKPIGYRRL
ncbi:MAG: hydrolase Nlp/P60 [Phenylobacterium zucineum]|nr:MAG: hydrolase Nlp/P60 [Phenylobacterium zucineum]